MMTSFFDYHYRHVCFINSIKYNPIFVDKTIFLMFENYFPYFYTRNKHSVNDFTVDTFCIELITIPFCRKNISVCQCHLKHDIGHFEHGVNLSRLVQAFIENGIKKIAHNQLSAFEMKHNFQTAEILLAYISYKDKDFNGFSF